tara:strand:+ start:1453 stop:2058 length:606 start_codon:yes stop_codon:yes gene_type:complete
MELDININKLKLAIKKAGYFLFENDSKNYNVNIIGIRESNPVVNEFNDLMLVAWKFEGEWTLKQYKITTLAGLHWLKNPMNVKGCAILKEGRYRDAYKIALHRGNYQALCQRKPVIVYRDNDRDNEYDFDVPTQEGLFGINIHRASKYNILEEVDKNSAGCQVFQDPQKFEEFMDIAEKSSKIWGNSFTYTLLNEAIFENV